MIIVKSKITSDLLQGDIEVYYDLENNRWTNFLDNAYDFKSEMAAESFIKFLEAKHPGLTISFEDVIDHEKRFI